jgi:hypothetical protein
MESLEESAIVSHAFFFPAATLEIRFQTGWRRRKCSALLSAFANPILSEKNLLERPKVTVLETQGGDFLDYSVSQGIQITSKESLWNSLPFRGAVQMARI